MHSVTPALSAHRGEILHCTGNPFLQGMAAIEHWRDGLLIIDQGLILACGDYAALYPQWNTILNSMQPEQRQSTLSPTLSPALSSSIVQHAGLLVPGFIDCHVHYPQLDIIGSHGNSLLDWLTHTTFPAESTLADPQAARELAERFLQAELRNGTTTAMVYGTRHPHSVDAFMQAAEKRDLRMICGKSLMDRHCPPELRDDTLGSIQDTRELITRWHNRARLAIAVTPRFAPSSTETQLEAAGQLLKEWPDLYMQTHLAETRAEVEWVKTLYPSAKHYLDVYDRADLIRNRSVLGHCIYLHDKEWKLLAKRQARIAHCPSSNFFLGSGIFNAHRARQENILFALGSDVGAGTSLSMLDTAGDAYLASALNGHPLTPAELFYLITAGAAAVLHCESTLGNFSCGKEADFIEILAPENDIPPGATTTAHDPLAMLFHLAITKQGSRAVNSVYIKGVKQ